MNKKISVFFCALFLTPIIFIPVADARPNLAAKFYLEEGKKEFKVKEYDLAIKAFNKALLADPDNEEALMYLKMLGFGGKQPQTREQEPLADKDKTEKPAEQKKSTQKIEKQAEKPVAKKTEKKKAEKPIQEPAVKKIEKKTITEDSENVAAKDVKNPAAVASKAVAIDANADNSDNADADEALSDIEDQISQEEAASLKALHEQAAEDQKEVLKKIADEENKYKVPSANSAKTAKAPAGKSKPAAALEQKIVPEISDNDATEAEAAKSAAVESAMEQSEAETTQPKKLQALGANISKPTSSSSKKATSEAALVAELKKKTEEKESVFKQKNDEQTAQKIEKIHAKFASQPIGEKDKTVFRDIDNDGIDEAISVKEEAAIKAVEVQSQKEEKAGLKKIEKQAAQDQKTALKNLRAQIQKEEKMRAKGKGSSGSSEQKLTNLKAGDVVDSSAVNAASIGQSGMDDNAAADESDLSPKAAAALADMHADVAQKEKDIELKYAKKKAMRLAEAEKKLKPQTQEEKVSLAEAGSEEGNATASSARTDDLLADQKIAVTAAPKSVQAQNVVLKKKLAQVVEMSQKDQDVIKDLESDLHQKDQKVEALESDLHETKTSLDTKVEMIKQKEEKLKDLSERIAAMESDVNSKQYDFKDKQMEYEKKLQAIQEEFGNYKTEKSNSEEELKGQLKILKEALEKKIAEFNAAQEKLIFTENKLKNSEEKYAQTTKQYDDVKKTLSDLETRLAALTAEPAPSPDKTPLVEIDPKNLPAPKNQNEVAYQQWIKRQDILVTKLKNKLLWAREQMEFLGRYDIKLSDQKMAALKEQLVAVKKQLSTKVPSGRTDEDFALMDARLKDSQERLEMVEKILHEKDDQVKELEKQLNQVLSAF